MLIKRHPRDHNVCPYCDYALTSLCHLRTSLRSPIITDERTLELGRCEEEVLLEYNDHIHHARTCSHFVAQLADTAEQCNAGLSFPPVFTASVVASLPMGDHVTWIGSAPLTCAHAASTLMMHIDAKTALAIPTKRADCLPGLARYSVDIYGCAEMGSACNSALLFLLEYESGGQKNNSLLCSVLLEMLRLRLHGRRRLFLCLDNGGGNKCGVLAAFATMLISAGVLDHVTIGWWFPHHGKGPADRFFGAVQRKVDNESGIYSVDQLARVINSVAHCGARVLNWASRFDVKKCVHRAHARTSHSCAQIYSRLWSMQEIPARGWDD